MGKGKAVFATTSFVIGSLLLGACTPSEQTDSGTQDTALTVAWNQGFYSLNHQTELGNAVANSNITYLVMDTFAAYNKELEMTAYPDYGTVEQISEEPLTLRFTLTDKAKWSDGTPVTAADTVLAWAAQSGRFNTTSEPTTVQDGNDEALVAQDEGTVYFSAAGTTGFELIEKFEVADDLKGVTFTFEQPYIDWFEISPDFGRGLPAHIVAKRALGIEDPTEAAEALIKAFADDDKIALSKIANVWNLDWNFRSLPSDPDLLVVNGPYALTGLEDTKNIILTAREDYEGSHVAPFKTLTFQIIPDAMAMVQALENGEVSLINPQATADVLESLQRQGDAITISTGDGGTYEHVDLVFNNGGPFDPATYGGDAEKARLVRQAFLLTIPRADIVEKIIKPNNPNAVIRQSYTLVPSDPNYADAVAANKQETTYPGTPDIEKAKALLAEAGVTGTIEVRFLFADNNTRRVQEYQLIQESAALAGFNVQTIGAADKWGNMLSSPSAYDASLFGWQSSSRAVTEPASNYTTGAGNNFGGFSNAEVDALYQELSGCFDEDRQKEINERVEAILVEQGFGVTIFQFPEVTAWDARLQNVKYITLAPTIFNNFYEWKWEASS